MKEREQPPDKLSRLDRLVQTFRIPQRSFDEIQDDIVVPLGMIAPQQNLRYKSETQRVNRDLRPHPGVVDHLLELLVLDLQTEPQLDLLNLSLSTLRRVLGGADAVALRLSGICKSAP